MSCSWLQAASLIPHPEETLINLMHDIISWYYHITFRLLPIFMTSFLYEHHISLNVVSTSETTTGYGRCIICSSLRHNLSQQPFEETVGKQTESLNIWSAISVENGVQRKGRRSPPHWSRLWLWLCLPPCHPTAFMQRAAWSGGCLHRAQTFCHVWLPPALYD